jgi:hypothetical protein
MRVVLRTAPLLLIGIALIGCGKKSGGNRPAANTDPNSPTVVLSIPEMH